MSSISEVRIGGSVSIEALLIYVSDVIITNAKKRKEVFVNTDTGVLVRITLWDKFADDFKFKAKQAIEFRNLRVVSYLTKSLNSCALTRFSEIERNVSLGLEIGTLYGEYCLSIDSLKSKATKSGVYGFIVGSVLDIDSEILYNGCCECLKRVDDSCTEHPKAVTESMFKVKIFLECDSDVIKFTLFQEIAIDFLGLEVQVWLKMNERAKSEKLRSKSGQKYMFKIRARLSSFVKEEKSIDYFDYSAYSPVIKFIDD